MRGNWQYFLLALLMSCTLWYMVSGREEVEAWTTLRIEMKGMPANLVVTNGLEPTVDVRVRAPKGLLRGLSERNLAYSLDLSGLTSGLNVINILPERVPLGSAYEVVELRPSRLTLNVDAIESREVPVKIQVAGALPADIRVSRSTVTPETVTLRGASSLLAKVKQVDVIATVPEVTEAGVVEVAGVVDPPDGLEANPAQVKVAMLLGIKTVSKTVKRTVEISAPEGMKVSAKSRKVNLRLEVPESKSRNESLFDEVRVELVVPESLEAGTHTLPYRLYLPEGIWLKSAEPSTLTVTIDGR
ncbi:CdaR family protein [Desulfovibrio mangrovi]|uniref:CdaR family protein n=1 Tax=Desulfovibrio mangrovi TaxID=2976983 RepID=UPI0022455660|nr:CdaR family protein [Desulfovibrio mangrovi]UZP68663.1 CdaR family protein [Desulfovibrio mangrovi]